jgi:hypothetical protein
MTDETSQQLIEVFDRRVERRNDRREFFKSAFTAAAVAGVGASAIAIGSRASAQAAPTDVDILNFALNLEYLEASFYQTAVTGSGLPANMQTGTGTQGAATGGRKATLSDPLVIAYAAEIAKDEVAHVAFLRSALNANGTNFAVAQPTIDIGTSPTGAFSTAAQAAGLVAAGASFDPYANDNSFLLGAFIFEDVGVTAYKGASPYITSKTYLEAAAGILAVEAYHASLVRTALYSRGVAAQNMTDAISNARDSLDGMTDLDQGTSPTTINGQLASNIVPLDSNGIAFSRSTGQVLNIVYLNNAAVSMGGFFPAGINLPSNTALRTSAAN